MKFIPILAVVFLIPLLPGCSKQSLSIWCADKYQSIPIDTVAAFPDFHSLRVDLPCKVVLVDGPRHQIRLQGAKDLIAHLLGYSGVQNGTLTMSMKASNWCLLKGNEVTIYATVPGLQSLYLDSKAVLNTQGVLTQCAPVLRLSLDGGAQATINTSSLDRIDLHMDGHSSMTLQGSTRQLEAVMDGRSQLSASDCMAVQATLSMDGRSNAQLYVTDLLHIRKLENGTCCYRGAARVTTDADPTSRVQPCR